MSPRAVVVSGAGRYADPWHLFAETSARLATVLASAGFDVEVDEDVDGRLADLAGVDLPVLNIGDPAEPAHVADAAARAGLLAHFAAGRPLLAVHSSATSLTTMPEWEAALGGVWVDGTSFPTATARRAWCTTRSGTMPHRTTYRRTASCCAGRPSGSPGRSEPEP